MSAAAPRPAAPRRRTVLAAAGAGVLLGGVLLAAAAGGGGADPAPAGPPTPAPAAPGQAAPAAAAAGDVVWLPGPWPERQVAGYPVLLPASATLGPLHPRPGGWASGYTADPAAAAIAALRAQLLLIAAPPALLPAIAAAVAAPASVPAITAGQAGLPRNTRPDWALPPRIADTLPPGELALLGATAHPAGPGTADVDTWHRYTTPGDQPEVLWLRSTTRMRHHDGEWRADPPDPARQNTPADAPPPAYTIPGPDGAAQ